MLTVRRGVRLGASLAMALMTCVAGRFADAQEADRPKQVLVLNSTRQDEQFSAVVERELPKLLTEGLGEPVDYYTEYFDFLRFPQPEYDSAYRDFLRMKYEARQF